jgi:hypothetical protein
MVMKIFAATPHSTEPSDGGPNTCDCYSTEKK